MNHFDGPGFRQPRAVPGVGLTAVHHHTNRVPWRPDPDRQIISYADLCLKGLWFEDGRRFAKWSPRSRSIQQAALRLLREDLHRVLSSRCTHVRGRGGVKGTLRYLQRMTGCYRYVARFDVASYYDSIDHTTLLRLLEESRVGVDLRGILRQYLERPDTRDTGKGMVAGGSLSPLMGALYLFPLDRVMAANQRIAYVHYMNDFVILARKRWHLRKAIREAFEITEKLKLRLHRKDKCFVGRVGKGFDFLSYTVHPNRRLRPSAVSLHRLVERSRRLYEQGGDKDRLWQYVIRWHRWLHGGLQGQVSRKGSIRRYYVYIFRRLEVP